MCVKFCQNQTGTLWNILITKTDKQTDQIQQVCHGQ